MMGEALEVALRAEAQAIWDEDRAMCRRIGERRTAHQLARRQRPVRRRRVRMQIDPAGRHQRPDSVRYVKIVRTA